MNRLDYIGGSDAATIMGVNPFQSRHELFLLKTGRAKEEDLSANRHIARGVETEPIIERYVRERADPTVNAPEIFARYSARADSRQIVLLDPTPHPDTGRPYVGGHPDGIGEDMIWEFKAPTTTKLAEVLRTGLPAAWHYQVQHYLMLTGLSRGCVAVWCPDRYAPFLFAVRPAPDLHARLRGEYLRFWSAVARGEYDEHVPAPHAPCGIDVDDVLARYHAARAARYDAETEMRTARALILSAADASGELRGTRYVATSTSAQRGETSYSRLHVRPLVVPRESS